MVTASQLYDYVQCPHRVALDAFGDTSKRDPVNPFLQLLWEHGIDHETRVVASIGVTADVSQIPIEQREAATMASMKRRERLIYGGRVTVNGLIGEPDLLQLRGDGYMPGDIKSGSGLEGEESEGRLKKHYACQVAHYVHILEQLGVGDGSREAYIVNRHAENIPYVLTEPVNSKSSDTWWEGYLAALENVTGICNQTVTTLGALCSHCKLCHWYSHCREELIASDDLTLIAELGRAKRDVMAESFPTVGALAAADPAAYKRGKKTLFRGVGPDTLVKLHERAKLLISPDPRPYLKGIIELPVAANEVFFDIEADPMRDVVYLHGFVERVHGQQGSGRLISFFADDADPVREEQAFRDAWEYLTAKVQDSVVYYYSKYERTKYKELAAKYPTVCSGEAVDALFALPVMVDLLYDVVFKATEWPTYDRSIKTLAQYLGFQWRDTHPSGAASIEWYHSWTESKDPALKQRILDYNEDDCLATGVLLDGIRALQ